MSTSSETAWRKRPSSCQRVSGGKPPRFTYESCCRSPATARGIGSGQPASHLHVTKLSDVGVLQLAAAVVEPIVAKGEQHARRDNSNGVDVLERIDERQGHRVHKPEDQPPTHLSVRLRRWRCRDLGGAVKVWLQIGENLADTQREQLRRSWGLRSD